MSNHGDTDPKIAARRAAKAVLREQAPALGRAIAGVVEPTTYAEQRAAEDAAREQAEYRREQADWTVEA